MSKNRRPSPAALGFVAALGLAPLGARAQEASDRASDKGPFEPAVAEFLKNPIPVQAGYLDNGVREAICNGDGQWLIDLVKTIVEPTLAGNPNTNFLNIDVSVPGGPNVPLGEFIKRKYPGPENAKLTNGRDYMPKQTLLEAIAGLNPNMSARGR